MIQNKVRKGDVVALAYTTSATYAFGSGRGTERKVYFTLAIVNGASRNGEANSLRRRSGSILERRRKDFRLDDVRVIGAAKQAAALAAFKAMTWESDSFDSVEGLRSAVLAQ